jgi:hypothetical protein
VSWLRRIIRVVRLGLLVVAGAALVLYLLSFRGVWWIMASGDTVGAYQGTFEVRHYGAAATVSGLPSGLKLGDLKGMSVNVAVPVGATSTTRSGWLYFLHAKHGRAGPGSWLHELLFEVYLTRFMIVIGVTGSLLLLVRAREPQAGLCGSCGYDMSGLAKGATCPECGTARLALGRTVKMARRHP